MGTPHPDEFDGDCPVSETLSLSSSSSRGFNKGVPPIFPLKMSSAVRARSLPVSSALLCAMGTCLGSSSDGLLFRPIGVFPFTMGPPPSLTLLPGLCDTTTPEDGEVEDPSEHCLEGKCLQGSLVPVESTPGSSLTKTGFGLPPPCLLTHFNDDEEEEEEVDG